MNTLITQFVSSIEDIQMYFPLVLKCIPGFLKVRMTAGKLFHKESYLYGFTSNFLRGYLLYGILLE